MRIRLCINGRPAVYTPNLKVTLKRPNVANRVDPAPSESLSVSATGSDHNDENLEVEVAMEADSDSASDSETGLGRCAHKQAAGTLEEYEEDALRLPGDRTEDEEDDKDDLTSVDIDLIHEAERFALQQDEPATDSDSDSEVDDAEIGDTSSESSNDDDEGDADFIPKLKLKRNVPKEFRPTGGKKRGKKVKKNANYTFCPLAHRLSITRLLCKHFCQHPMLPERHGQPRTPEQIHRDAVLEMYYHCKANNLRDVWGYLWVNWYAPGKWELWARSSYAGAIPRKRTTMVVEALWRNFKRMVLYHYNRPRVDLATHALITQAVPPYRLQFNQIVNDPRDGCAKRTHGEQLKIQRTWINLRKRPAKGSYAMDLRLFLCACGTQKYHSYHLCKHLVQKLDLPSPDWWAKVVRRHTPPFYDTSELIPASE